MKHDYIDILHDRLSQHEMTEPSWLWQEIENSLDSHGTHKKKGLVASRSAIYKVVAGVAAAALVAIVMWTALNDENNTSLEGDKQDLATNEQVAESHTSPNDEADRLLARLRLIYPNEHILSGTGGSHLHFLKGARILYVSKSGDKRYSPIHYRHIN